MYLAIARVELGGDGCNHKVFGSCGSVLACGDVILLPVFVTDWKLRGGSYTVASTKLSIVELDNARQCF